MSYQIVQHDSHGRNKLLTLAYQDNAKDFAVKSAEESTFDSQFEVVNEKTGNLVGYARRDGPGTPVQWHKVVVPIRRDVL